MKRVSILSGALIALALAAAPAQAVEYLNNGGFETGDFSGWTQGGNLDFTNVVSGLSPNGEYSGPQSGTYYTYAGPGDTDGSLSQTFVDIPGEKLTVFGWVISDNLGFVGPSHVNFLFNGLPILSTGDPVPDQPWTQYSFSAIATGNDTFTVAFRDDLSYVGLDSFSVSNSVSAVPEASTWLMMILGFAGLSLIWRQSRLKAPTSSTFVLARMLR
jgi:hypothetical protein